MTTPNKLQRKLASLRDEYAKLGNEVEVLREEMGDPETDDLLVEAIELWVDAGDAILDLEALIAREDTDAAA